MDGSDNLIGGFASGDGATPAMKREQDSTDDFEHLDRDGRRDETEGSPLRRHEAARHDTQSFLDMERAPPAADKMDHLADKFTDSESDADTAGESPQHVAEPPTPAVLTPAPAVEASAPISEPKPEQKPEIPAESKPTVVEPKSEHKPEPKLEPVQTRPVPEPVQPPVEPVKPKPPSPTPEPPRAPTAHVIEAEVIFCQIGLAMETGDVFVNDIFKMCTKRYSSKLKILDGRVSGAPRAERRPER